ncbi:ATP-binding cassette domain-containing protein [Photobacterium swingsii]|uniref:ATP-binding cassette domain-containing protein n=1 Tax=Photobacterium swingsii TaxID=680026 RepID=UPI001955B403|nr:ABC transporter ATP-binding protein [Photobacterium swingsii]
MPQLKNGNQTPIFDQLNVELKDVTFAYPGAKPLFKDLNLSIKHGAVTALVGPSGSGKSTLAALIARFWELDKGDIWVGGNKDSAPLSGLPLSQQHMVRLTDMDEEYWLKHVSVVFQSSYLFNDTIANNLRVAKADASDEALCKCLKLPN